MARSNQLQIHSVPVLLGKYSLREQHGVVRRGTLDRAVVRPKCVVELLHVGLERGRAQWDRPIELAPVGTMMFGVWE